jgi:hypothetical protein
MLGITLTPDQLRSAPVDVRRWIEQEFAKSLGLQAQDSASERLGAQHLVGCSPEEADAVLTLIRGMLPVVNVFFELGRQGASFGQEGLEAFRLLDVLHHTRLQNMDQVIACLDIINEAARRLTGDSTASLVALDDRGDCIVARQTQESILRVWQQTIAGQCAPARAMVGSFPVSARFQSSVAPSSIEERAAVAGPNGRQGVEAASA